VKREVSQLRSVVREAGTIDSSITPLTLLENVGLLAQVLREPSTAISRATGRSRLLALQRYIRIVGPKLGRDPDVDLAMLDAQLPTRRSTRWHATGALVGGTPGRRRGRGPTLDGADLRRILDAAGTACSSHAVRDRALVALHCFSGLRPEEIVHLCWEDIEAEITASGHYGLTAAVIRCGRRLRLLLPGLAEDAIDSLANSTGGTVESLSGYIFCARGVPGNPLSYRAARDVLRDAIHQAGLPTVDAALLRAACGHWLRSQGLSDHEVAKVLGLARVRSVDRLLRQHAALDAQRTVREILALREERVTF
jgi:integrase